MVGGVGEHTVLEHRLAQVGMGQAAANEPATLESRLAQDRVAELGVLDDAIDEDRLRQIGVAPAVGWVTSGPVGSKGVPHWHDLTETCTAGTPMIQSEWFCAARLAHITQITH
jgi:hypothetical protein